MSDYARDYYQKNKEKMQKQHKEWLSNNKEKANEKSRQYKKMHNNRIKEYNKDYHAQYYEDNKAKINARQKEIYQRDKDKIKARTKAYAIKRLKTDLNYKLRSLLRRRILNALNGMIKHGRTMELLGCSIEEFKKYIELHWLPGMAWENHGLHGWHIDHIVPCSAFNLTDPVEQKQCFHYTNLQPLWGKSNWSKHDKWII